MTFLAPLLLAGLAALAIPIIVHLVQRERRRVVEFPSLMFLRKIPYQSVRRRAIRHWPLLLMRCLALALIVVAFARPFWPGAGATVGASGGGREVVILLDRSYSMGHGDRWARAQEEARRVVRSLGPDDRVSLAFFAGDVEVSLRSSTERGGMIAAIDRAETGAGATRYAPALRAAAGLIEASTLPRREIVVISDFQRSGWDRTQDVKLPPGVTLATRALSEPGAAAPNAAIAGLALERETVSGRERVIVTARLVNRGDDPIADREVTLEVGGRRVDSKRISIAPHTPAAVAFAPFPLPSGSTRVIARLASDSLPIDDEFHAVVTTGARVPVLIVESTSPSPDASLYLARALEVGRAPAFAVETRLVDQLTPAHLSGASVIVLNDTRPPSGAAARQLEASVRGGAGLLLALGERSTWPDEAPDLLPGRLGGAEDRSGTRGGTLGFVDDSHPAFEIFRAPHSGDLTAARVFRYRRLDAPPRVVARFDDGAVAVAERLVGAGRVMAWTSTLDSYWNDLALKPVFVPFVHQTMKHLARYIEARTAYTIGDAVDPAALAAPGAPRAGQFVALTPGGVRVPIAVGEPRGTLVMEERGFYEIRMPGGETAIVAANVDPAESDLTPFDPAELVGAVAGEAGSAGASGGEAPELTVAEQERRQALWWYLLAGGLLLLVAEAVVANRLPKIA
jgi:hypothetical protein